MKRFPSMKHGDVIRIKWLDIVGDSIGEPDKAAMAVCVTTGHFHGWKGRGRNRALVLCLTLFPEENNDCRGSDIYPHGVIQKLEVLSYAKRDNELQDSDGVSKPGAAAPRDLQPVGESVEGRDHHRSFGPPLGGSK